MLQTGHDRGDWNPLNKMNHLSPENLDINMLGHPACCCERWQAMRDTRGKMGMLPDKSGMRFLFRSHEQKHTETEVIRAASLWSELTPRGNLMIAWQTEKKMIRRAKEMKEEVKSYGFMSLWGKWSLHVKLYASGCICHFCVYHLLSFIVSSQYTEAEFLLFFNIPVLLYSMSFD